MEKGLDVVNKGVFNVDSCRLELEGYLRNTHTKWIKYESSHDKHRMNLYLQKGGSFQVLMLRTITILFSTKSYLPHCLCSSNRVLIHKSKEKPCKSETDREQIEIGL